MTTYSDPFEQRFEAKIKDLARRLAVAEQQLASLTLGAVPVTSSTHPASPVIGMRIYETDTDLEAFWTGSTWQYPPQQIAKTVLGSAASSIPLTVPSGPAFTTLRVAWTGRSTSAGTADYMCLQINGDTGTDYAWDFNQSNVATDSSAGSGGAVNHIRVGTLAGSTATAGYLGSGQFVIPNAAGSTFKGVSSFSNSTNAANNGFSGTYGGLRGNFSDPVSSLTLFALSGNLDTGSSATLYGET